ncbi:unnamed protein product [Didymodactylos carnosus]|uniref:Uncharacterized protein n=1 Tax=Didymodactylos carnosus TaxID=1234261 RepID=A0A815CGY2_9BILA|nr:unnamed protein product [Didymodactylos carnosus]CAF1287298.1 unnamed protein product [Didymodactylos carnosus]CAF3885205.1 unnamed protein product [Didymodactylos carnosus]CAF4089695.1 unnamed protein product [Didymodactylos carnosus]
MSSFHLPPGETTSKQAKNRKNREKKRLRNQTFQNQYPPFDGAKTPIIHHITKENSISLTDSLIVKAHRTSRYRSDTERQRGTNEPALIQIEFVDNSTSPTVIIVKFSHLPLPSSTVFSKIKTLLSTIFDDGNNFLAWDKK